MLFIILCKQRPFLLSISPLDMVNTLGDDPKPFVPSFPGSTSNLPELDAAAHGIGSINWISVRDQVVRRVPLVYRVGDQFMPTLPREALRVAQGASTYVL